jgi:hypothetical protein
VQPFRVLHFKRQWKRATASEEKNESIMLASRPTANIARPRAKRQENASTLVINPQWAIDVVGTIIVPTGGDEGPERAR